MTDPAITTNALPSARRTILAGLCCGLVVVALAWGTIALAGHGDAEPEHEEAGAVHETHWAEVLKGVGGGAGGLGGLVGLLVVLGKMGVLPAITIGGKKPAKGKDDPEDYDSRLDELEAAVLPRRGRPMDERVDALERSVRELSASQDRILAELAHQRDHGDKMLAALTTAAAGRGGEP